MRAQATQPFPPRAVIAHRGRVAPGSEENTLDAFAAAIAGGADAIELDVRRLADGALVVFHDDEAGGHPLRELTRRELQLAVPDRRIASFEECAKALRGLTRLDVELKDTGIARRVLEALARHGWDLDAFAVTSFDAATLADARAGDPDVAIGLLTEHEAIAIGIARAAALGADFLAPDDEAMNEDGLRQSIDAQIPLVPWVVNDAGRLRAWLAHESVAGVITDALSVALAARRDPV